MSRQTLFGSVLALAALVGLGLSTPAFAQLDAKKAENLFKDNDCQKCHATSRSKKGPSLQKIAADYRDKKLDENEAIKHMTSGKKVKLDDGSEEDHKIVDTKDVAAQLNLAKWILSH